MKGPDLTNRRFGWLKVEERCVREYGESRNREYMWRCRCCCGKLVYARTYELVTKGRKRCARNCPGPQQTQAAPEAHEVEQRSPAPPVIRTAIPRRGRLRPAGDEICRVCGRSFTPREGWHNTFGGHNYCSWPCTLKARDAQWLRERAEKRRRTTCETT